MILAKNQKSKNILISLKLKKNEISYIVGLKRIPYKRLLDYFGELCSSKGIETQVMIQAHENIPFSKILDLKAIIQKAGLGNIRYFFFNSHTKMMIEIFFGERAIPITTFNKD